MKKRFNALDEEMKVYEAETKEYRECTEVVFTATGDKEKVKSEEKKSPKSKSNHDVVQIELDESIDDPRLTLVVYCNTFTVKLTNMQRTYRL